MGAENRLAPPLTFRMHFAVIFALILLPIRRHDDVKVQQQHQRVLHHLDGREVVVHEFIQRRLLGQLVYLVKNKIQR